MDKHRCGRRPPYDAAHPDVFKPPYGDGGEEHPDEYRDGRCTYCGSVSQEAFLKFVEDGGEVGPTDKSYKVYLTGVIDRTGKEVRSPGVKFYFQHLDEHGRAEFIRLYNERKMRIGYPGHFYARPYFCGPAEKKEG